MSVQYQAVLWNRQKRIYDSVIVAGTLAYLGLFVGAGALLYPTVTIETLLIRGFGTLALFLLHVILCIGPLCRLDKRFLPLLYNRRHLGVSMFLLALVHGVFSIIQFHSLGDVSPFLSVLISNTSYASVASFPFEILGLFAVLILFLMAATSHDFWLHHLSAPVWKRLHMMVYLAYGLIVAHVVLGALQSDANATLAVILGASVVLVSALHLVAATRERREDSRAPKLAEGGFVEVCEIHDIPEKRAKVVTIGDERIAVFRYDGKISAISNVCRHQNGPLGEGRIIDGCVTCPWHGYQYLPDSGMSPPPFTDKVSTYRTRVSGTKVFVHSCAHAPGERVAPSRIEQLAGAPR